MKQQQSLISTAVTIGIIGLTLYIIHPFIPSMIWAGIIAVSTYPAYGRFRAYMPSYPNLAACLFTFLLSLVLILPLSWLLTLMVQEGQIFVNYLQVMNREGGVAPEFLKTLPFVGNSAVALWDQHIGHPGFFVDFSTILRDSLSPMSFYIKQIGLSVAHRGVQIGFTILTLFFFYRDGEALLTYINELGHACLNERWSRYFDRLPAALRATVNGTILVGLGVGLCMGICYALLGFPTPTFTGFITAFAAMIPFAVPAVFVVVSAVFLMSGQAISALIVMLCGTIVMFVADHFVKPVLIGGTIQLPFLAVLFGILGGLETLGLLGLFVGPIVFVLFITLCQELKNVG